MRSLSLAFVVVLVLSGGAYLWFSSQAPDSGSGALVLGATPTEATSSRPLEPAEELEGTADARRTEPERTAAASALPKLPPKRDASATLEPPPGDPVAIGRVLDDLRRPMADVQLTIWAIPTGIEDLPPMMRAAQEQFRRRGKKKRGSTDEDGNFRIDLPSLEHDLDVVIEVDGYLVLTREFGQPRELPLAVGDLELQKGCMIRGTVVDSNGAPIHRATVRIEHPETDEPDPLGLEALGFGGPKGPRTGKDGRFEFLHEEAGEFVVHVDHKERPSQTLEGFASEGQALDVQVVMPEGGRITGRILDCPADVAGLVVQARRAPELEQGAGDPLLDEEGQPQGMVGAVFEEMGMASGDHWTKVEPDGTFALEGLAVSGAYKVWAAEPHRSFFMRESVSDEYEAWVGEQDLRIQYQEGVRVDLQIVDARTNEPVREYTVSSQLAGDDFPARRDEVKDRDGRTSLTKLRPRKDGATLHIAVRATGYETYRHEAIVPERGEIQLGRLMLMKAPLVKLEVVGGRSESPVEAALAVLVPGEDLPPAWALSRRVPEMMNAEDLDEADGEDERPRRGETDEYGRVELNSFPGRSATLLVMHEDFATQRVELELPLTGDIEQRVHLVHGSEVVVQLLDVEGFAAPRGRVEHWRPWAGDEDFKNYTSDEQGRVVIEHLAPGEHRFRARQAKPMNMGFRPDDNETGGRGEWVSVLLEEGEQRELELLMPLFGSLFGVVTEGGEPLAGASLALLRVGSDRDRDVIVDGMEAFLSVGNARTNERGEYRLENVASGEYELRVRHSSRAMPETVELEIEEGDKELDVELAATAIEGRVTDADGRPLAGATIRAIPEEEAGRARLGLGFLFGGGDTRASATTDAGGNYRISGLNASTKLVLRASAKGHSLSDSEPIELAEGEVRRGVDLTLAPAGAVALALKGARPFQSVRARRETEGETQELGGVDVPRLDLGGGPDRVSVARRGQVVFDDLEPGRWTFSTRGAESQTIEVEAGGTYRIEFEITAD